MGTTHSLILSLHRSAKERNGERYKCLGENKTTKLALESRGGGGGGGGKAKEEGRNSISTQSSSAHLEERDQEIIPKPRKHWVREWGGILSSAYARIAGFQCHAIQNRSK